MITYENENGSIMQIETLPNAIIRVSIGSEKQLNLISETETEKIYKWQKFNFKKGVYEDDTENNEVARIDGREYTPSQGRVVVHKKSDKQRIQELELAFADEHEKRLKNEEIMNQIQIAMTEIYESQG